MVKLLSFRIQQCFGPFTMLLVETTSERGFLNIDKATFFGAPKLKTTSTMRVIFVLKIFTIKFKFRKSEKKMKKNFFFEVIVSEDVDINSFY